MSHRHLALALLLAAAPATATAASVYPAWTIAPASSRAQQHTGTLSFGVPGFPASATYVNAKSVDDAEPVRVASTDVIAVATPWGGVFGSSSGRSYLSVRVDYAAGTEAVATYRFLEPVPPGAWGFTLGDIDVDQAEITARDGSGQALSGAQLAGSVTAVPYNFITATSATLPSWSAGAAGGELIGANDDETEGDAGWFMPSRSVQELTVRFTAQPGSGSPSYRTWFAVIAHPITGTVLREDTGAPVEGDVLVLVDPDGTIIDVATSDAQGNYAFPQVYARPGYTVTLRPPAGLQAVGATSQVVSTQAGPAQADFRLRAGESPVTPDGGNGNGSSSDVSTGDAALVLTPGRQVAPQGAKRVIAIESTCTTLTQATIPRGVAVVAAPGGVRQGRVVRFAGGTGSWRLVLRPVSGRTRTAAVQVRTTCADGSQAATASRLRIIMRPVRTRVTG